VSQCSTAEVSSSHVRDNTAVGYSHRHTGL
jgi:hypothetical protein